MLFTTSQMIAIFTLTFGGSFKFQDYKKGRLVLSYILNFPWCQGSRSELGYTGNICPYCEGTGQETVRTGHITARSTCSYCNGEKIFIKYKCLECEGIGKKTYDTPLTVHIPAGKHLTLTDTEIHTYHAVD